MVIGFLVSTYAGPSFSLAGTRSWPAVWYCFQFLQCFGHFQLPMGVLMGFAAVSALSTCQVAS